MAVLPPLPVISARERNLCVRRRVFHACTARGASVSVQATLFVGSVDVGSTLLHMQATLNALQTEVDFLKLQNTQLQANLSATSANMQAQINAQTTTIIQLQTASSVPQSVVALRAEVNALTTLTIQLQNNITTSMTHLAEQADDITTLQAIAVNQTIASNGLALDFITQGGILASLQTLTGTHTTQIVALQSANSNVQVDVSTLLSRVFAVETLTGDTILAISVTAALSVEGNSTLVSTLIAQGTTIQQMSGLTGSTSLVTTVNAHSTTLGMLLSSLQLANATLAGRLNSLESLISNSSALVVTVLAMSSLGGNSKLVAAINGLITIVGQLSSLTGSSKLIATVVGLNLSTSTGTGTGSTSISLGSTQCWPLALLSSSLAGAGSVLPSLPHSAQCSYGQYAPGQSLQVWAVPTGGWGLAYWSISAGSIPAVSDNPLLFTMWNGPVTLTATFGLCNLVSVGVTGNTGGSVSMTPAQSIGCQMSQFAAGFSLTVQANPIPGLGLSGWSGSVSATTVYVTYTMSNAPASFLATFADGEARCCWRCRNRNDWILRCSAAQTGRFRSCNACS
jgi:hypothetical protein